VIPPNGKRLLRAILVPALIGLAGAWLALVAFGRDTVGLGPFQVQLSADLSPGWADTEIRLPPFGQLTADTHAGPLELAALLRDVGVERLTELLRDRTTEQIVGEVERDARAAIAPFAIQVLAVGSLGGLVVGLVAFRTRWRRVVVAAAAALLVVGGTELLAWRTFDPLAFQTPQYTGSLAVAADLIGPVRQATGRIDAIRQELERLVEGTLRAYRSIQVGGFGDGFVSVLHISDIHLSPLGLGFAREVAEGFDVDLVLDTGDLTSFGTPAEELIVELIPSFNRPYVFVPGNHDSDDLSEALGRTGNAVVVDGRIVRVAGLRIYGLGHPVFTPNQRPPLPDRIFEAQARSSSEVIEVHLSTEEVPPDVIAVHDDRMAEALAGTIPLVVSGHFHETSAREIDGTVYLRIGSTGGSGAGVFTQNDGIPFEAEVLYLEAGEPGEPARLVAFDVIQQSPLTGSLTVTRHLAEEEFPPEATLVPGPSPASPNPS
jgi:predicted phosphodiesterase